MIFIDKFKVEVLNLDTHKGGFCNVIYFKQALNSSNIYYLYNMVKGRTPPVLNDSNTKITKENIN